MFGVISFTRKWSKLRSALAPSPSQRTPPELHHHNTATPPRLLRTTLFSHYDRCIADSVHLGEHCNIYKSGKHVLPRVDVELGVHYAEARAGYPRPHQPQETSPRLSQAQGRHGLVPKKPSMMCRTPVRRTALHCIRFASLDPQRFPWNRVFSDPQHYRTREATEAYSDTPSPSRVTAASTRQER